MGRRFLDPGRRARSAAARAALAVAAVAGGLVWSLAPVSPATATPSSPLQWGAPVVAAHQPAYGVQGTLSGVSCPSSSLCAAVDDSGNLVTSTDPTGGTSAWSTVDADPATPFYGVSCPTVSLCVAVDFHGDVVTSTDPTGGAGAWTVTPADSGNILLDVSCPSAALCVAGDTDGHVVTSTDPTGGAAAWTSTEVDAGNWVTGVSCPMVSLCVASAQVGTVLTSTDPAGGATSWTPAQVDGTDELAGVSCATTSMCVAVDQFGDVVTTTDPTGGAVAWTVTDADGTTGLSAVSCPSASLCVATDVLGEVVTSTDPTGGAGAWTPVDVDGTHDLPAVSCPSTSLCVSVDQAGDVVTATDPTGGAVAWTVTPVDGDDSLTALSCPSEQLCVAVDSSGHVATAADPAGGSGPWSVSDVDGAHDLQGVSCPSALLCVAVDQSGDVVTSTDPTGGAADWTVTDVDGFNLFTGVSCPSSTLCVAVDSSGNVVTSTDPTGGSTDWTVVAADPAAVLEGVSCPSSTLCAAVDGSGNVVTSTDPTGGATDWTVTDVDGGTELTAVGCHAGPVCVAADQSGDVLSTTDPAGGVAAWHPASVGGNSVLTGVSCPTASSCEAVDYGGNVIASSDPTGGTGSWTVTAIDVAAPLGGISCPVPGLCVAVDDRGDAVVGSDLPVVTAVSPPTGSTAGGAPVTVTGRGFDGATSVDFGSSPATVTACTDTSCEVTSPAGTVGPAVVTVTTPNGTSSAVSGSGNSYAYVSPAEAGPYAAVAPVRICDTRAGNPSDLSGPAAQCDGTGNAGSTLASGVPLTVDVAGQFDVPADATAVVVNVTAIRPSGPGYVTVYPAGATVPTASNLNMRSGQVVPGLVEVGVGAAGAVSVVSNVGTDVAVDLEGYVMPGGSTGAGLYDPLPAPARICDTRAGDPSGLAGGDAQCGGSSSGGSRLTAGTPLTVTVDGDGGVPASGVSAVVLNVTVTGPSAPGYLTAYPHGTAAPTASNLNFATGETVPNRVIVPVSATGQVSLVADQATDVLVDVSGWFSASGGSGDTFTPALAPVRICDTRSGDPSRLFGAEAQCDGVAGTGEPVGTGSTLTIDVTGLAGVPRGRRGGGGQRHGHPAQPADLSHGVPLGRPTGGLRPQPGARYRRAEPGGRHGVGGRHHHGLQLLRERQRGRGRRRLVPVGPVPPGVGTGGWVGSFRRQPGRAPAEAGAGCHRPHSMVAARPASRAAVTMVRYTPG